MHHVRRLLGIAVALAALGFCSVAAAQTCDGDQCRPPNGGGDTGGGDTGGGTANVPEFDPSVIGGIAAVLAGGSVVFARRRAKS